MAARPARVLACRRDCAGITKHRTALLIAAQSMFLRTATPTRGVLSPRTWVRTSRCRWWPTRCGLTASVPSPTSRRRGWMRRGMRSAQRWRSRPAGRPGSRPDSRATRRSAGHQPPSAVADGVQHLHQRHPYHQRERRPPDGGCFASMEQIRVEGQQLAQTTRNHPAQRRSGAVVVLPAVQRNAAASARWKCGTTTPSGGWCTPGDPRLAGRQ